MRKQRMLHRRAELENGDAQQETLKIPAGDQRLCGRETWALGTDGIQVLAVSLTVTTGAN